MSSKPIDNLEELAKAIFVVNKHAKTAPNPRYLYNMKKTAINKLLKEKQASKVGLHFSDHPKLSHQHSTLLVQVSNYFFHIPPSKEDFKMMKHLGSLDSSYRNPKTHMSLSQAKKTLCLYLDWEYPEPINKRENRKPYSSSYFTPSSLGHLNGSPFKKRNW
ncbi:YkyB family protein [Aquibacillus kalidii]|uniref:YkyB family protein n=1 Tax=Aquibacillus kalidii TaxID=2762597 RepID=UPI001C999280|nr:YkyB family protein [Aquibacillus kalidii]